MKEEIKLIKPVDDKFPITQLYGENKNLYPQNGNKGHSGIDWGCPVGSQIYAAHDGKVIMANPDKTGYGEHIRIQHKNGYVTIYGHLSAYRVKVGDNVKAGDVIGYSGNTGWSSGPHTHFELRLNTAFSSNVDPMPYITSDVKSDGKQESEEEVTVLFSVKIKPDMVVNMRSGPGTENSILRQLMEGEILNVAELINADNVWIRTDSDGYVKLNLEWMKVYEYR
jgi:hypothetical protein